MTLADAVEAPAKDDSEEEVADGTAGVDGLFDAQRTEAEEVEYGRWFSFSSSKSLHKFLPQS